MLIWYIYRAFFLGRRGQKGRVLGGAADEPPSPPPSAVKAQVNVLLGGGLM